MTDETLTADLPDEPPYKVGYGNPPKQHQFKPGQSGNPSGRPKGLQSFNSAFAKSMSTTLPVTIDGQRTRITRANLLVDVLLNAAVGGQPKAMTLAIQKWIDMDSAAALAGQSEDNDPGRKANDNKILTAFAAKLMTNQSIESHDVA